MWTERCHSPSPVLFSDKQYSKFNQARNELGLFLLAYVRIHWAESNGTLSINFGNKLSNNHFRPNAVHYLLTARNITIAMFRVNTIDIMFINDTTASDVSLSLHHGCFFLFVWLVEWGRWEFRRASYWLNVAQLCLQGKWSHYVCHRA